MKVLLVTAGMSPAEATWVDALDHAGHVVDVYDVNSAQWLRRKAYHPLRVIPEWVRTWDIRSPGNALSSFFRTLVGQGNYDHVMSSGLVAGGALARYSDRRFSAMLWRGDLDFSASRAPLGEDFLALTAAVDRIFLEDEYEFDKALSKGSRSAHLLHPRRAVASFGPLLGANAHRPRVAVLHPENMPETRIAAFERMLGDVAARHGGDAVAVSTASLYRLRDAQRNRRLDDIASTRLEGFTHAVLIGISRDHSSLADLLCHPTTRDRLVVDDTIGLGFWADDQGFTRTGRGARLAELLDEAISNARDDALIVSEPESARDVPAEDPLALLCEATSRAVQRLYEELRAANASGPLNVFFSTSPLEDRTNGARPQRVRNMAEALDHHGPAIRLYSTPQVFERRKALINHLLDTGRPAGLLYAENSTSPIPFDSTLDSLSGLFTRFRAAGGRSAWFVRDLHWLENGADFIDEPARRQEFVARGLRELRIAGEGTDSLLAPCEASVRGFQGLLRGYDDNAYRWGAMPPGVAAENSVAARPGAGVTTLLYAGGVGSFYAMDSYLSAISSLPREQYRFDFLVRAAEVENLMSFLASHNLDSDPRVTISTDELDVYVPREGTTIGTVLLDSAYARFAFPYKTVSMLEKGFPLLTYRDMAIADFVESKGIGEVCDRTPESLAETLEAMRDREYTSGIEKARISESWTSRIKQLESLLAASE